jgi:hypothetical protein
LQAGLRLAPESCAGLPASAFLSLLAFSRAAALSPCPSALALNTLKNHKKLQFPKINLSLGQASCFNFIRF